MELRTERLLLRDFKVNDWRAVQEYAADPEAVKYRPFGPCTDDETRVVVEELARQPDQSERRLYDLAIVLLADDLLIGGCDIGRLVDDPSEAGVGYILNRAYWSHGYMTEAARALLTFGFEILKVERISADVDPNNIASVRVLEKIGMRCVGQRHQWMKGRDHEVLHYVIAVAASQHS